MKFLKSIAFISLSVFVIFVFNISKVYAGGTYFSMYNDTYDCLLNGDIKLDNSTYAPGSTMIITGHINSNNCSKAIVSFAEIQVSFNGGSTYGDIVVLVGAAGPGQGTKYWQVPTNSTPGLHTLYFYERQANLSGGYYTKYSTINYYVSTNSYDPFVVTGISNPVPVHSGDTVNGFWYGGPTSAFTSASCSVSASPGGLVKNFSNVAGGDFDYVVNGNTLFNLVCGVTGGTVSDQFNVTVDPTATISASPTTVGSDNKTTLTWNSNGNAQYCLITKTDSSGSSSTQEYPYGTKIESITSNTTFSAKCYNGYAYSNIPSVVVHPYTAVAATLSYTQNNIKDLVRSLDSSNIGKTHLHVKVENLAAGKSCSLQMNNSSTGITYTSNGSTIEVIDQAISNIPSGVNSFKLVCDGGAVASNIVTVNGQSGTLEATNGTSCQIPAGGSSCSIPLTWTTISPANSFTTKLYKDGVATSLSGNSSSGTVSVNHGTSPVYSTKNKIDGEGSNNNETIDNELASLTLSSSCVSGSTWNGTICEAAQTSLPDLTAIMTESSYGAFVGQTKYYAADITNNGSADVSGNFYNLFQVATASGSSGGGSGVSYKSEDSFIKRIIKNISRAEAETTTYTIIKNTKIGPMAGLSIGETKRSTASISIDSEGTYYVRACADKESQGSSGSITELYENNNCSDWVPVSVTPVPPVPAPDLIAYTPSTTAGIGSTQPLTYTTTVGKTLTFYSTILNQGSITTNKSFQNSFQIQSDITQYIATPNPMPALADGAVATASKAITFSNVGTFKIRACADIPPVNPGVVSESNENNNCSAYTTVNVVNPTYPDLTASDITPTEATAGIRTTFYATISNIGQASTGAGKGFYNLLQWYDPDINPQNIHNVTSDDTIASLGAGESAVISRSLIFSEAGQYYARVCADLDVLESKSNIIVESDENNNCGRWTLINVSKENGTTGDIQATSCEIDDGYSNCESKISWNTYNPVSGAISAVTTPVNQTVATGNTGSATYKIEYTESPRNFYLYHNNELLAQATATAKCKNNNWNEKAGICLSEGVSDNIVASDCEIQENNSTCISNVKWYVAYPGNTTPAVTSDYPSSNTIVGSGSSGDESYKIRYGTWKFFLYNNSVELGSDPATAYCTSGTIWNEARNVCVKDNSPIDGGWSDWNCGSCSVPCGGGTQSCTRSCTNPVPANGGSDCVGPSETTQTCNPQICVEDQCLNGAINYPDCNLCPDGSVPAPGQECTDIIGGGGNVSLTAVPSWIFKGRSSTLTWESWPGATCNINPGNMSVSDSGNKQVSPVSTTTYTAVCTDGGSNAGSAETTVRVIKPIIFEN